MQFTSVLMLQSVGCGTNYVNGRKNISKRKKLGTSNHCHAILRSDLVARWHGLMSFSIPGWALVVVLVSWNDLMENGKLFITISPSQFQTIRWMGIGSSLEKAKAKTKAETEAKVEVRTEV